MLRTRRVCLGAIVLVLSGLAAGCGGQLPPRAPAETRTTSAELPRAKDDSQTRIAVLEHERDDARARLAEQVARNEAQSKRLATERQARRERTELALAVTSVLEGAQVEIAALDRRIAKAPSQVHVRVYRALATAKAKGAVLEARARAIGTDHGAAWPSFKVSVEAAMADLQHAVDKARESD